MQRFRIQLGLIALLLTPAGAAPVDADWKSRTEKDLKRILQENIIPFWFPQVIDREAGGYKLNHGSDGSWRGASPKALVTQARTVWFFSALFNNGYARSEYLEAAEHGYRFLREKMWDQQKGGFYWEVSYDGNQPTRPDKHLYGNAFGLYALSEYAAASGDRTALALARELFALLERHAHDKQFGGYREFFLPDWSRPPEDSRGYMGVGPDIKLMNTHLHLMEALTTFYRVTRDPLAQARLHELILIQSNAVVRKDQNVCSDKFQRDWTPLTGPEFDRLSYGHDVENIWLLQDACRASGLSFGPLLDLSKSLLDNSLEIGFDREKGGFFYSGPFGAPPDDRQKSWWVQAEALVGLLRMYQLTGRESYRAAFDSTLEWIKEHQVDWQGGDWFASIDEQGKAGGDKAGPWKSPYHNGRAMLECLRTLGEM